MVEYLSRFRQHFTFLDVGCGNGLTLNQLRKKGYNVVGMDITLAGLDLPHGINTFDQMIEEYQNNRALFTECSIWDTPFKDKEFDITYSTDVLEHIPEEKLEDTIKELFRITKIAMIHIIATFPDKRQGFDFHLSVKPIEEWQKLFDKYNTNQVACQLFDRTEFLKSMNPEYKGK